MQAVIQTLLISLKKFKKFAKIKCNWEFCGAKIYQSFELSHLIFLKGEARRLVGKTQHLIVTLRTLLVGIPIEIVFLLGEIGSILGLEDGLKVL